jgi:hypothetical protein
VWTTLAAVAVLAGSSWAIGSLAIGRVLRDEWRLHERLALVLTAGLGLTALLLAAIALGGQFAHAPIVLGIVIAVRSGRAVQMRLRRAPVSEFPPDTRANRRVTPMAVAVALTAVLAALGAIAPVTDDDALAFGVPCARHIADTGSLRVWSDQARSMFPQSQMLLLAFVLRMGGDRLGAVTAFEWLLCLGVMSALARRFCERSDHAVAAVIIALGSPVMAFQVASAKEDLLALAATLATACFLEREAAGAPLAAAGMFAGLAAGAKYSGVGMPVAVALWVLVSQHGSRVRSMAIVAGSAFASGGLWYVLNAWQFANPVAPLVFGASGTHFDAQLAVAFSRMFGAGRGVGAFVAAPLRVFVQPSLFGGRANLYNAFAYAGLAGLFVGSLRRRHAPLLLSAAVLYAGWFFALQNARLLVPAAALLAPAAADCLVPLVRRHHAVRPIAYGVVAASLGIVALVGVLRVQRYAADPATYLDRESQRYADLQWMNTHLDPARHRIGSSVKVIGYLNVPSLVLDPTRQLELSASDMADAATLAAALRRQRVTHVFGRPADFDGLETHLRVVHENAASVLGGVRFFRAPPTERTAVYELID